MVLAMPSRVCRDASLDPATCNALMNALIVFSVLSNDSQGELVEFKELAAILEEDWPEIDKQFEALLRAAWQDREDPNFAPRNFPLGRLAAATSVKMRKAALSAGVPASLETESTSVSEFARKGLEFLAKR